MSPDIDTTDPFKEIVKLAHPIAATRWERNDACGETGCLHLKLILICIITSAP
jgi:hypothetical protein